MAQLTTLVCGAGAGGGGNGSSLGGLVPSFVRSGGLRANAGTYTDSPVNGLLYVRGTVGARAHPHLHPSHAGANTSLDSVVSASSVQSLDLCGTASAQPHAPTAPFLCKHGQTA